MNSLSLARADQWPNVIFMLGILVVLAFLICVAVAAVTMNRSTKVVAKQKDDLRQLVHRYEQLSENTLDAQQRTATHVAELVSRTASIEKILRTVE